MRSAPAATVDEYLDGVASNEARESLRRLRATLRKLIPDAEEVMSYGMPAFRRNGIIVWYAAFKKHCSLFAGETVADFAHLLGDFGTSKGTIRFEPGKPIPDDTVRQIVEARVALDSTRRKRR